MSDLSFISDYRKKKKGLSLDKQIQKHTELLALNTELIELTGTNEDKEELIGLLRGINDIYLEKTKHLKD